MLIKCMLSSLQKEYCKNIFYFKATSQILGMQTSFHVSKENMEKICFMATIKPSRPVVGPATRHSGLAQTSVIKASIDPPPLLFYLKI